MVANSGRTDSETFAVREDEEAAMASGPQMAYAIRGFTLANTYSGSNPTSGMTKGGLVVLARANKTFGSGTQCLISTEGTAGADGMAIGLYTPATVNQYGDLDLFGSIDDGGGIQRTGNVNVLAKVGSAYLIGLEADYTQASLTANYRNNYKYRQVVNGTNGSQAAAATMQLGRHLNTNAAVNCDIFGFGYYSGRTLTDAQWLTLLEATMEEGALIDPGGALDDYWKVGSVAPGATWVSNSGNRSVALTGSALTHVEVPLVWGG